MLFPTYLAKCFPGGFLWCHTKISHLHIQWARAGVADFWTANGWYWWS